MFWNVFEVFWDVLVYFELFRLVVILNNYLRMTKSVLTWIRLNLPGNGYTNSWPSTFREPRPRVQSLSGSGSGWIHLYRYSYRYCTNEKQNKDKVYVQLYSIQNLSVHCISFKV